MAFVLHTNEMDMKVSTIKTNENKYAFALANDKYFFFSLLLKSNVWNHTRNQQHSEHLFTMATIFGKVSISNISHRNLLFSFWLQCRLSFSSYCLNQWMFFFSFHLVLVFCSSLYLATASNELANY